MLWWRGAAAGPERLIKAERKLTAAQPGGMQSSGEETLTTSYKELLYPECFDIPKSTNESTESNEKH